MSSVPSGLARFIASLDGCFKAIAALGIQLEIGVGVTIAAGHLRPHAARSSNICSASRTNCFTTNMVEWPLFGTHTEKNKVYQSIFELIAGTYSIRTYRMIINDIVFLFLGINNNGLNLINYKK